MFLHLIKSNHLIVIHINKNCVICGTSNRIIIKDVGLNFKLGLQSHGQEIELSNYKFKLDSEDCKYKSCIKGSPDMRIFETLAYMPTC